MTEPPRGFLELGTTEVGDEVAMGTRTSAKVMAVCGALGLLLALNARFLLAPALWRWFWLSSSGGAAKAQGPSLRGERQSPLGP